MARSMNVGDYDLEIPSENGISDDSEESEFNPTGIQIPDSTDNDSLENIIVEKAAILV